MVWLVIGIVVLILLVLSTYFRKIAATAIVIIGLVGGLAYFLNEYAEERSLSRITAAELDFRNVTVKPGHSGYNLAVRVQNNSSEFTLKQVGLRLAMQDCTGEGDARDCVTIGESDVSMDLNIPPGQARDVEKTLYFSGSPPKILGELEWSYSVSKIKGE